MSRDLSNDPIVQNHLFVNSITCGCFLSASHINQRCFIHVACGRGGTVITLIKAGCEWNNHKQNWRWSLKWPTQSRTYIFLARVVKKQKSLNYIWVPSKITSTKHILKIFRQPGCARIASVIHNILATSVEIGEIYSFKSASERSLRTRMYINI